MVMIRTTPAGRTSRSSGSAAAVIVLLSAAIAAGCAEEVRSDPSEANREAPRPSLATRVESEAESGFATHLYSERDADIFRRVMAEEPTAGAIPVTAIYVEVGDRVREGQLLATLESLDAELYVAAAEPEAANAAATLRRVEELADGGVVSASEYDEALYASRKADAILKQAELMLSRTQIRAPFAGVVSRRYVKLGDMVDEESPLFRVTALAPLRARLLVAEAEATAFAAGAPVGISGDDGSEGVGRVLIVSPTVDPGSGTREVIVELTEVGDFRPGAAVRAAPLSQTETAAP